MPSDRMSTSILTNYQPVIEYQQVIINGENGHLQGYTFSGRSSIGTDESHPLENCNRPHQFARRVTSVDSSRSINTNAGISRETVIPVLNRAFSMNVCAHSRPVDVSSHRRPTAILENSTILENSESDGQSSPEPITSVSSSTGTINSFQSEGSHSSAAIAYDNSDSNGNSRFVIKEERSPPTRTSKCLCCPLSGCGCMPSTWQSCISLWHVLGWSLAILVVVGWVSIIVVLILEEKWLMVLLTWLLLYAAGHFGYWYLRRNSYVSMHEQIRARVMVHIASPMITTQRVDPPPTYEEVMKAELPPPSYYTVVTEVRRTSLVSLAGIGRSLSSTVFTQSTITCVPEPSQDRRYSLEANFSSVASKNSTSCSPLAVGPGLGNGQPTKCLSQESIKKTSSGSTNESDTQPRKVSVETKRISRASVDSNSSNVNYFAPSRKDSQLLKTNSETVIDMSSRDTYSVDIYPTRSSATPFISTKGHEASSQFSEKIQETLDSTNSSCLPLGDKEQARKESSQETALTNCVKNILSDSLIHIGHTASDLELLQTPILQALSDFLSEMNDNSEGIEVIASVETPSRKVSANSIKDYEEFNRNPEKSQ